MFVFFFPGLCLSGFSRGALTCLSSWNLIADSKLEKKCFSDENNLNYSIYFSREFTDQCGSRKDAITWSVRTACHFKQGKHSKNAKIYIGFCFKLHLRICWKIPDFIMSKENVFFNRTNYHGVMQWHGILISIKINSKFSYWLIHVLTSLEAKGFSVRQNDTTEGTDLCPESVMEALSACY